MFTSSRGYKWSTKHNCAKHRPNMGNRHGCTACTSGVHDPFMLKSLVKDPSLLMGNCYLQHDIHKKQFLLSKFKHFICQIKKLKICFKSECTKFIRFSLFAFQLTALLFIFIYIDVYLLFIIYIYLCIYIFSYLFIFFYIYFNLYLFLFVFIYFYLFLFIFLNFIYLFICIYFYLFSFIFIYFYLFLFIFIYFYLLIFISFYFFFIYFYFFF